MNQVRREECAVCWRPYSYDLVPMSITCGHSFCQDCCENLRKCPLCRRRLQNNSTRVTNYSLLSLVNRLENEGTKEMKDQEVQTEKQPKRPKSRPAQGAQSIPTTMALSAIVKLSRIQQMLAKTFVTHSNS